MIKELFGELIKLNSFNNKNASPKRCFSQDYDWTCSIACFRSITSHLSLIKNDKEIIDKFSLKAGPNYSKDIKKWNLLSADNVIYGCDIAEKTPQYLYDLLDEYYVMVECMINYDHWLVVLGYYTNGYKEIDKHQISLYDPFYNNVRVMNAEEFFGMWCSGKHESNGIICDFIAVKK